MTSRPERSRFPSERRELRGEDLGRFALVRLPRPIPEVLHDVLVAGGGAPVHARVIAIQVEVELGYIRAVGPSDDHAARVATLTAVARRVLEQRGHLAPRTA